MLTLLAPALAIAVIGWSVDRLFRRSWNELDKRRALLNRPKLSPDELSAYLREYGRNSNSFMTLYPGFEYFASERPDLPGYLAFVDTPRAWVGAAEPLVPEDRVPELLEEFARAAASLGKAAILIPVSASIAESARKSGYESILIGTEVTFELDRYPRSGRTWVDVVPSAKRLDARGAQVVELDVSRMPAELRTRLDEIKEDWLASRKMSTLGFLNQVDPWLFSKEKKYFYVEEGGRVLAFLAAIPIPRKNGWYLIDLLRASDSPAGATELVLLGAIRKLRESGARIATLGVAPLSGMESAGSIPAARYPEHRLLYRILRFFYESGSLVYNFKSLHSFKAKLEPTSQEPAFLIYRNLGRSKSFGLRNTVSLFQAFLPNGLARAAYSGVKRSILRFDADEWIRGQLSNTAVVRSVPRNWSRLLQRCKVTVTLLLGNWAVYFLTADRSGMIRPTVEENWGYSWSKLLHHPIHALAISPFLHWNPVHIVGNFLMLVAFMGGLEYLVGSALAAGCFFIPALLTNPLTSFLFWALPIGGLKNLALSEYDVGASLGIFGCAGALSLLLRHRGLFLAALLAATVLYGASIGQPLALDHIVALGLGFVIGKQALERA